MSVFIGISASPGQVKGDSTYGALYAELIDPTTGNVLGSSAHPMAVSIAGSSGNTAVNLTQVGGSAVALGSAVSAASLPVVIASDQAAVAVKYGSGTFPISGSVSVSNFPATQPVSGTVTANQGTAGAAAWPVFASPTTDSYPSGGTITVQDTASTTVQGQYNQNQTTGTPTAGSFVQYSVAGYATMEYAISGTWTGTLTVEGANAPTGVTSATVWTNKTSRVPGSTLSTSSFTANVSDSIINCAGYTHIRIRATAAMTGTATVGNAALSLNLHCFDLINPVKLVDGSGTTGTLTILAASTAAGAANTSAVVALSPNSPLPTGTNSIGTVINGAGAAIIGKVGIDQTTPGTTNGVQTLTGSTTAVTGNVTVVQGTGTNLHTVVDSGTITLGAGSAAIGSVTVTQATAASLNATVVQATAANLNATVVGSGNFTVTQATGTNLHAVIDSGTITLGAGSAAIGTVTSKPNLSTTGVSTQLAVTATAAALASNVATNGVILKALSANTISVYYGFTSGVTTATGIELTPGGADVLPLSNSNEIYVIASTTGASVAYGVL